VGWRHRRHPEQRLSDHGAHLRRFGQALEALRGSEMLSDQETQKALKALERLQLNKKDEGS